MKEGIDNGFPAELKEYIDKILSEKKQSWQDAENEQLLALDREHLREDFERSLLFAHEDIPDPAICLEIVQGGKSYPIATTGNFSTVIGKAKSRKTFALTAALAAAVGGKTVLNMRSTIPKNSQVILFDTEQSRYDVKRCIDRLLRLAGLPNNEHPDNLNVSSLRGYSPSERLKIIEYAIENTSNLGFVVIDGIRDVVSSINDEEQATSTCSKLLRWTEEKDIHIITVLHENKSDSNARGHLGTEMVNKGETTISITKDSKDKSISVIECNMSRQIEFEPYAFTINSDGLPVVYDDFDPKKSDAIKAKYKGVFDIEIQTHYNALHDIFQTKEEQGRGELLENIRLTFDRYKVTKIGQTKTRDFLTFYLNEGMINKSGIDGTRNVRYTLNEFYEPNQDKKPG